MSQGDSAAAAWRMNWMGKLAEAGKPERKLGQQIQNFCFRAYYIRASALTPRLAPTGGQKACLLVIGKFHNPEDLPVQQKMAWNTLLYFFIWLVTLWAVVPHLTEVTEVAYFTLQEAPGLFVTLQKTFLSALLLSSFRQAHQNTWNQKNAIWKASSPLSS